MDKKTKEQIVEECATGGCACCGAQEPDPLGALRAAKVERKAQQEAEQDET